MNNKLAPNSSHKIQQRIVFLDGLRGIAILMVIFFHAFARWEDLMPYQNQFNGFHLFKYGKFGVQLFFIISGFVILMTLENCHSFSDFIYRRWLRLFPAMLICTIFIFFTAAYFPYRPSGQPNIGQLIPGLLFLDPEIIKLMFNQEYMAIEGSFWSLFVEVKFYIIAGVLFFYLGKKRMILSVALLFLMSTAHVKLGQITVVPEYIDTIIKSLSIEHFGWFAAGALFYEYSISNKKAYLIIACLIALLAARNYNYGFLSDGMGFSVIIIMIFFLAVLNSQLTKFVEFKLFTFLGFISYPLYLLHENMMVSMIVSCGEFMPWMPQILLPLFPILFVVFLAYIIAKYLEPLLKKGLKENISKIKLLVC